jgi:phototropin
VPMTRARLTRDFTSEEDTAVPQVKRYRDPIRRQPSGEPRGYDVDGVYENHARNITRDDSRTKVFTSSFEPTRSAPLTPERGRVERLASHQKYQDNTSEHAQKPKEEDLHKLDFNLTSPTEANYEPSITSTTRSHATDTPSALTNSSGSRLPDFFSNEVFQVVLHNPTTSHQLLKFARSRMCAENLEFLTAVDKYHTLLNDVASTLFSVHKSFLSSQAPSQINLPEGISTRLHRELKANLTSNLPKLESIFVDSQSEIEHLVANDIYPRFVRHQVTLSATRALATEQRRSKYAGLGDCFVLTDPAKADNPIVYASDGFVKVTGYTRNEIIPRNCRFLQGRQTDRKAVKRLRVAIDKNEETVELLLNERKDGEPFWNLLLVAPLRDARGNVIFFMGGQINCSTTVHSQSDVLKVLATNEEETVEEKTPAAVLLEKEKEKSRASRFFSSFRSQSQNGLKPMPVAGMEGSLLGKMDGMGIRRQAEEFYSAYSKVRLLPLLPLGTFDLCQAMLTLQHSTSSSTPPPFSSPSTQPAS